jgi:hypothetical protein
MGWPEKQAVVKPLATNSAVAQFRVKWTQNEKGLTVRMPERKPCDHAVALKVFGA